MFLDNTRRWQRRLVIARRERKWPVLPAWLGSGTRRRRWWFIWTCAKQVPWPGGGRGPSCQRLDSPQGHHAAMGRNLRGLKQEPEGCSWVRTLPELLFMAGFVQLNARLAHMLTPAQRDCRRGATSVAWEKRSWRRWSIKASPCSVMPQLSLRYLVTLSSPFWQVFPRNILMKEVKKMAPLLREIREDDTKSVALNIWVTYFVWWCFGNPGFWYRPVFQDMTSVLTWFC